jgi:hypothetical protein
VGKEVISDFDYLFFNEHKSQNKIWKITWSFKKYDFLEIDYDIWHNFGYGHFDQRSADFK